MFVVKSRCGLDLGQQHHVAICHYSLNIFLSKEIKIIYVSSVHLWMTQQILSNTL